MSSVRRVLISCCAVLGVTLVALLVVARMTPLGRWMPAEIVMMTAVVPGCGNELIEVDEECDGSALAGATCQTKGFTGGVLTCTKSCLYNVTACTRSDDVLHRADTEIPETSGQMSSFSASSLLTRVRTMVVALYQLLP